VRIAALNLGLFVVWLCVTTALYRGVGGTAGVVLASLWPLALLPLAFGFVWWRGRRYRRKLIAQEWRR